MLEFFKSIPLDKMRYSAVSALVASMPGPVPLRSFPAVRHGRFPSLDDEKVNISMNPSSSQSPAVDDPAISKRSRQEVHCRAVRDAMVVGIHSHASTRISTHSMEFERDLSSSVRVPISLGKKGKTNDTQQGTREPNTSVERATSHKEPFFCVEVLGPGTNCEYTSKQLSGKSIFHIIHGNSLHNPVNNLMAFLRSCVVPDGYPESVSSSYAPYMQWRAMKYLFGGAMGVFTTRSLLQAVGVSRHGAATTAMAVNWVIKDGAGRVGKLLFARHGKKFDSDMKQLRFTGDLLMELGAAVELATASAPHLFLPLACAANIAKNVAAVSSTSTRASIYKSFARGENIGDVTAKGECISNIADLLGTGIGILISKQNPSLMATFAVLSCGYLCCSYQEIKSVCLPTLNRARFKVAVQTFLETGKVPSVSDGNHKENIFINPWLKEKPFALGARINEAFESPNKFLEILPSFQKEKYLVTYDAEKSQAFAILKVGASSDDVLRASFHAQVLENIFHNPSHQGYQLNIAVKTPEMSVEAAIKESCEKVPKLFESFKTQAMCEGWVMGGSLLNPGSPRLSSWKEC